jgi:hypothetical protein
VLIVKGLSVSSFVRAQLSASEGSLWEEEAAAWDGQRRPSAKVKVHKGAKSLKRCLEMSVSGSRLGCKGIPRKKNRGRSVYLGKV